MKTNLEDFVRSVYDAGYYMRAYDKGVPCGEVSIVSDGLVYDNFYGSEEVMFEGKDFNDTKDISKEDFSGLFSKKS